MSQMSSSTAQVTAVFVECIFYGIYLATLMISLRSISTSHSELSWALRMKRQRPMLIVVLLIFIGSTLNLALGFVRVLAFVHHDVAGSGEIEQLGQDWINIVKPLGVQFQTMIADYVLIYRCWIVYNKSSRVVILPTIFYLGLVVCTVLATMMERALQGDHTSRVIQVWIFRVWTGFWVSTISLNIYATSMIVLRIWRVERESKGRDTLAPLYVTPHPSRLQTVMKAIIESGLLYTVASIITFISLAAGSNSLYITTAVDIQIIGIAFNLVLIRVNNCRGEPTVTEGSALATLEFAPRATSLNILASRSSRGVLPNSSKISPKVDIIGGYRAAGMESI